MNVVWKDHVTTDGYSESSMRAGREVDQRGMNLVARKNRSSAIGTTSDEE
jgi:hypothetical protein